MLVIWTSLALAGLLFDLVNSYGSRLISIKIEQKRQTARNAALLCRDMLLIELSENTRFVPEIGQASELRYRNMNCRVLAFSSTVNLPGGETKVAEIQGSFGTTTTVFSIETKINISDVAGSIPEVAYTKEISES